MWQEHWIERGYSSWDEWRENYAAPLRPETLDWQLYEIKDPLEIFPQIYGVPSHGWIEKAYDGKITMKLQNIIDLPVIKDNPKILDIRNNFPTETMFTGIVHEGRVVLIEGMHRASALVGWNENKTLKSKITIALADWKEEEIPIIGSGWKNKK